MKAIYRKILRVYRGFREMRTFESLQRYGATAARRRGIMTERDVERLIAEARRCASGDMRESRVSGV